MKICRSVAESKLSEGKHKEALPAAQFYLRCSIDIHGPNSAQLIPVYLLLADTNMGQDGVTNLNLIHFFPPLYITFECLATCLYLYLHF